MAAGNNAGGKGRQHNRGRLKSVIIGPALYLRRRTVVKFRGDILPPFRSRPFDRMMKIKKN
jgi:hypothetical protein